MIYNFFSLGLNCFFFFFVIDWPWPRDIIASYDREKGKERERETDFYEYKCAETICVLVFCLWMLFSFKSYSVHNENLYNLRISSVLCVCLYLMFIQQGLIFIYIFFLFKSILWMIWKPRAQYEGTHNFSWVCFVNVRV